MQTKRFGSNGTRVPVLGLGCARIGSFNNPASARETSALLDRALDLGACLFDTADVYGQGDSERAIGRVLRRRHQAGFVVSKAGIRFSTKMRLIRPFKPLLKPLLSATSASRDGMTALRRNAVSYDFVPDRIVLALEASLRRLKMDALDAFLLHGAPADVIRDTRIVEMLWRLRRDGKVKTFGVSCEDAESCSVALEMEGLEMIEVTRSILDQLTSDEREILRSRHIGVLVREALRGRGTKPADHVVAELTRCTDVTCTVVGTTSIRHLEELARAVGGYQTSATAEEFSAMTVAG